MSAVGALAAPIAPSSLPVLSALPVAPIFSAAPTALPSLSAAPQAAALSAAAVSAPSALVPAPTTAATPRSTGERFVVLAARRAAPAASAAARGLSAAAFDGAAARSSTPGDDETVFEGPNGQIFRRVPGSRNTLQDQEGRVYRLKRDADGDIVAKPVRSKAPPAPEASAKTKRGLTKQLLTGLTDALQILDANYVEKLTSARWRKLIDKGLTAIFKDLGDSHTQYFDKAGWAEYRKESEGGFTGIGVTLDLDRETAVHKKALDEAKAKAGAVDDAAAAELAKTIPFTIDQGGLRIRGVRKGSPAATAKLKRGDVVVSANGQRLGGRPYDAGVKLLEGPAGSKVKMTVARNGKTFQRTVTHAELEVPVLFSRMVAPEIGYLYYYEFRTDSENDFVDAIHALRAQGAKKIIIDLRANVGGSKDTADNILANLLPAGAQISSTMHRGETTSKSWNKKAGPFARMKKVVLVDEYSASGSELTAATLQDYGVTVIGSGSTYGKFSFQEVIPLPRGKSVEDADAGIKFTGGRFYSGKGRSMPGRHDPKTDSYIPGTGGVTPDVIVPTTPEQRADVRAAVSDRLFGEETTPVADPVLDKAIEILRGRR
jgi:carboxyl-terminal processing protease